MFFLYSYQLYRHKFLRMMGLYSEAVHLALENGHIDDAKIYANKPENDETKKKLWLQVKNNNNKVFSK